MPTPASVSSHDLGPQLAPALLEACHGRISEPHWFKVDWQHSGAATAYATYEPEPGVTRDVVIKIPVGPTEYRFTTGLATTNAQTPRLAFHGTEIGGYDFAWIVMERLPGDPLAARMHADVFEHLAEAAASFYKFSAETWPVARTAPVTDWADLIAKARTSVRDNSIPDQQRWAKALKAVSKSLNTIVEKWRARPINTWCHGDLHAGNLMARGEDSNWGAPGYILLDMAEVHAGHWIEDGVYLERLYWARPEALHGVKPVQLLANARKAAGLTVEPNYADIANIRRLLLASCVPAFLKREGHPKYLAAAIDKIERLLPAVAT